MISESLRENLFKKIVDDIFSSGTGEFDEEEVYQKIPRDLNINAVKAKEVVQELARSRLSNSLVQAVALLRQRNHPGVLYLRLVPEELADLFLLYLKSDPSPENLARVQYLLNINDSTAEALRAMKDRGLPNGAAEEEFVL
ncbi:TIC110, chloroplastic isoform X1 [Olea europaea subsp. europaea]|uniref:TIC110, chloroplastic isoform X1 n=1 Tax=Olea europaea subsp. europaea TaxID=158383 RepID=A0A8S0PJF0_OLEEU|nr:TIC110, chloroplastic isoform X1 [Olea europaea subsp. europaea]